jgi:DNA-binding NarL/FixJ family response regulator
MEIKNLISILVVDDDKIIRRLFSHLMELAPDMEMVAQAASGREAVRLYAEYRPDVVLMDINLPEMNGLDATIAICQEFPEARVILFSANLGDLSREIAKTVGAAGAMTKPIRIDNLLKAIRNVHAGLAVDGQAR